jgi:uncharacterized protein with GYD domain
LPKYLFEASYTSAGSAGVIRDGGSQRRAAAEKLIESLGGTIDCMYFAFGTVDVLAIVDLPDHAAAAAMSLATASSGAMTGRMTVLLTPEEIDDASSRGVTYTPPGQ